jgi:hypothetical protein
MSTGLKEFVRVQGNGAVANQRNSQILIIPCCRWLDKRQKQPGTMLDHSAVVQVGIASRVVR